MSKQKGFTLIELLVTVTIVIIFGAISISFIGKVFGIPISISEGERTGIVTKISKKGIKFKTWEAQMNLGGLSTNSEGVTVPNVWAFSIKDDELAKTISEVSRQGSPVTIQYEQMVAVPFSVGETNYLAKSIQTNNKQLEKQ